MITLNQIDFQFYLSCHHMMTLIQLPHSQGAQFKVVETVGEDYLNCGSIVRLGL